MFSSSASIRLLSFAWIATLLACGDEVPPPVPEPPSELSLPSDDGWHAVSPGGPSGRLVVEGRRPDVVVILIDAARADVFGAYGDPRPTPAIDALAAVGTRFANALAPAPWTGASVPALLTGLHPEVLGAEHWESRLPGGATTLAERLSAAGYHTGLFSQHPLYGSNRPLLRGFDTFIEAKQEKSGDVVLDELPDAASLLAPADEGPSFAFFHLLPPHTPYDPPPPFLGSLTGEPPPPLDQLLAGEPVDAPLLSEYPHRRDPAELSSEARRFLFDRYREMACFADALVGRLLDDLRAADRFDDTLVMVLSDHGEAFLEHEYFMHTRQVYREALHIPWVVKWPRSVEGFGPVVDEPVSLVDLVPTLIDGLGLAAPDDAETERFQGPSLMPRIFDGVPLHRAVVSSTRGPVRPQHPPMPSAAIELDGWSLVRDLERGTSELFDLANDPGQQHDLAAVERRRRQQLEELLERRLTLHDTLRKALGETASEGLDPETQRQLEALGYL